MTIDEAIRKHKENIAVRSKIENDDDINKHIIECDQKYIEWLEELKAIKEMDLEIPQHFTKEQSEWVKSYCIRKNKEFYNKVIDDFANYANTMPTVENEDDGYIRPMNPEEMAEKLRI